MFTDLCDFLLFVSENSNIFKGDAELQLTLADHVGQLKTIVIKFWISGRVFFQQNKKLVNRKQPLNVALDKHISLVVLLKAMIQEIAKKKKYNLINEQLSRNTTLT